MSFKCDYCEKEYVRKNTLTKHIRKFHPEKIPDTYLKCEFCDKKFETKTGLYKHLSNTHPENVNLEFKCEHCGKEYKTKGELTKHIKKYHTEKIPDTFLKCKICDGKFENNSALRTHINRTHNISPQEYYNKYFKKKNEGICTCGKKTVFRGISVGYLKFCSRKCSTNNPEVTKKRMNSLIKNNGNTYFSDIGLLSNIENKPSNLETLILDHIKSIYTGPIETNVRYLLKYGREIDIYLPHLKIAIEINGIYWHSIENKIDDYHVKKREECKKLGINILQFWEHDIKNRFDFVKDVIFYSIYNNENYEVSFLNKIKDKKIIRNILDYDHSQILIENGYELIDNKIYVPELVYKQGNTEYKYYRSGFQYYIKKKNCKLLKVRIKNVKTPNSTL